MLNLIITSDCCGSDVVLEDICTACGEHCEVIKEEITAWQIKVYSVECRYTNKEKSYHERIRPRITIDCYRLLCYSCISVQQLHPLHSLRKNTMPYNFEYFQELESYEAQEEYNIWLDEQDDFMVRCHEQEMSPEVVE